MIEFYQMELRRLDFEESRAASHAVRAHIRRRIEAVEGILAALIAKETEGVSF